MKKIIIALMLVFLVTGCTFVRIDTSSIDNIINVILSKDNDLYNTVGKGYKYYKPRGVTYIDTNEYNEKLYSDGNYYYLYVDINSYYYKREFDYKENEDAYYSRLIEINDKLGYLEINEYNNKYLIEFMYNYAKIEALVDKGDINNVVLNSSYILSTIKFNSKVIKIMLIDNYFINKEERYDIFTPKDNTMNLYDFGDMDE